MIAFISIRKRVSVGIKPSKVKIIAQNTSGLGARVENLTNMRSICTKMVIENGKNFPTLLPIRTIPKDNAQLNP